MDSNTTRNLTNFDSKTPRNINLILRLDQQLSNCFQKETPSRSNE